MPRNQDRKVSPIFVTVEDLDTKLWLGKKLEGECEETLTTRDTRSCKSIKFATSVRETDGRGVVIVLAIVTIEAIRSVLDMGDVR